MKQVCTTLLMLAGIGGTVSMSFGGTPWEGPRRNKAAANRPAQSQAALPNAVGPWGEPVMAMPKPLGHNAAAKSATLPHGSVAQTGAHCPGPSCPAPYVAQPVAPIPPVPPMTLTLQRSQLRFVGPARAKIGWYVPAGGVDSSSGQPVMTSYQLTLPGIYNFLQASIYRLKLSEIPGREGIDLYPTIEVVPANSKTSPFLAHNFIPVEFTEEDFDQVTAGNYITKVIYLPDPQFQSPVGAGPEELVSTRLDPGVDPIAEAHRRGNILLVIRMGGINLEAEKTPPIDSRGIYGTPKPFGGPLPAAAPSVSAAQTPVSGQVSAVLPAADHQVANNNAVIPAVLNASAAPTPQPQAMRDNYPVVTTVNAGQTMGTIPQQLYVPDSKGQMVLVTVSPANNGTLMPSAAQANPAPAAGVVATFPVPGPNQGVQQAAYTQGTAGVQPAGPNTAVSTGAETKTVTAKKRKNVRTGLFNGFGGK